MKNCESPVPNSGVSLVKILLRRWVSGRAVVGRYALCSKGRVSGGQCTSTLDLYDPTVLGHNSEQDPHDAFPRYLQTFVL